MKVAVVGSRNFNDYVRVKKAIDVIQSYVNIECIVSGGAKGADSLGAKYADENNIEKLIFLPEWNKYGRSAGFKRNKLIIEACDFCIAFWDGKSKGTKHSIDLAKKLNKGLKIIQ